MRTAAFLAAVAELHTQVADSTTAVMCSKRLWWRCHRRLIADFTTLARGTTVCHLAHDFRLAEHRVSAGARLSPEGVLVYDVPSGAEMQT